MAQRERAARTVAPIVPLARCAVLFDGCRLGGYRDPRFAVALDHGLGRVPDLVEKLERFWRHLDLRGFALVKPWPPGQGTNKPELGRFEHPLLTMNVLARVRGQVLLPRMPLDLGPGVLERRMASTDRWLVELVRAHDGHL